MNLYLATEPDVLELSDATVLPCLAHPDTRRYVGGVYTKTGLVSESLLISHDIQKEYPGPEIPAVECVSEPAIYCGRLTTHFGHFLLESLSRLWFAKHHPERKLVWTYSNHLNEWQKEILELLGVRNDSLFVETPTSFTSLSIPSPGYVMKPVFRRYHCDFLACVASSQQVIGKRLYVSRTRLPDDKGGYENEQALEQLLSAQGWEIFHPQRHSVREQLDALSSAEIVLGVEGSAFHALMLLKDIKARIYSLVRTDNENYATIAAEKGLQQTRLNVPRQVVSGKDSALTYRLDVAFMAKLLADTNQLTESLEKYIDIVVPDDARKRQRSLDELAVRVDNIALTCPEEYREYYFSAILQNDDLDKSIEHARNAVALNRGSPGLHHHLGHLLRRSGRLGEAATAYRNAIAHDSSLWLSYFHLSHVLADTGNANEAIQTARQALEGNENALFSCHLGKLLMQQGDLDEAEQLQQRAVELNPALSMPHFYLSVIAARHQQLSKALYEIDLAIEIDGPKPLFMEHKGSLSARQRERS